ncbi:MAG: T9SS type A sorting domain-containing protein [Psychroserpens sp.]|nr:T9SS type A sorting domain-containing protein [Psychroserpens sp.]
MKKILLFVCALLIVNVIYSQADLFVGNGSYVFVDGTEFNDGDPAVAPLYVTDEIDLDNNGYLYLRNGAQLIQGNDVGNSGLGRLSVYQNGTVHNWAYNYWCSPVGNVFDTDGTTPLDNTVNNPFKASNLIYDSTGLITSTLATFTSAYDGTSSPLQISNRWLYTYNPGAAYSEWDFVADTGDVGPGYGFTMKGTSGSGNNQLYDFRGKANNGTMITNVLNGNLTLAGNPYPSAIDARDYIWDTTNRNSITGTLFFWEQDLSVNSHYIAAYVGGYATYTINETATMESFTPATFDTYDAAGNLVTTGSPSSSGKTVGRYIPIGQGFMIEGNSGANTTARTTNSMRIFVKEGAQSEFFRTSENTSVNYNAFVYDEFGYQIIPDDYKRFRLNIDFDETYTRQLLHNFHDSATEGFDYGMESKFFSNLSADCYWVLEDDAYVTQAHAFDLELKIPLVVKVEDQQPVRFRIFDVQNFDDSQPIYIHDIENDLYVDLRSQNYDINLPVGTFSDRFEITFINKETLSNNEVSISDFNVFQNNSLEQLTIKNPLGYDVKSVSLFDVAGKQVFRQMDLGTDSTYHFSTKSISDGVYVTVIELKENSNVTKKVVIKNN